MLQSSYASSVFINCPIDNEFTELRNAIVFAVFDCGFIPRSALEDDNAGNVRIDKIQKIIEQCKFGIHDISRTELDEHNKLPRFNMPLELGVFMGAKRYGDDNQKQKNYLVLDREKYRYQQFISDIAGQDIRSHEGSIHTAISVIRSWLNSTSGRGTIPGGNQIWNRYNRFCRALPEICADAKLTPDEVTYNDYSVFVSDWLQEANLSNR